MAAVVKLILVKALYNLYNVLFPSIYYRLWNLLYHDDWIWII